MKDNEDVYYEEQSAFSFKDMFTFIKHAFPTIIVSIVICVMVGVSVCGIMYSTKKNADEITQAIIELKYEGADKGLAPDGSVLQIQDIKNIDRIGSIVSSLEMPYSANEIRNAISISGYYSPAVQAMIDSAGKDSLKLMELIKSNNINPTQYIIKLDHKSIANMTSEDSKIILDELVKVAGFSYSNQEITYDFISSSEYTEANFGGYDYLERISMYSMEVMKIESHIKRILNQANKYSSPNGNVKALVGDKVNNQSDSSANASSSYFADYGIAINSIVSHINSTEVYILNNGIADNLTESIAYLDNQIKMLESNQNATAAEKASLLDAIEKYGKENMVIINDKGIAIAGGQYIIEVYNMMYVNYLATVDKETTLIHQIDVTTKRKALYEKASSNGGASDEVKTIATQKLAKLTNEMAGLAHRVELDTTKYYKEKLNNGFNVSMSPATVYINQFDPSWLWCIVISGAVGVLLGLGAYAILKQVKIKKRKQLAASTDILEDNGANQKLIDGPIIDITEVDDKSDKL